MDRKKIEILVTVFEPYDISVRWLKPFHPNTTRALKETLLEIEGVESVTCRRYSAEVEVAPHVATVRRVAEAVVEALRDADSAFQYALRFELVEPELEVGAAGVASGLSTVKEGE